jgi:hypothetical protein
MALQYDILTPIDCNYMFLRKYYFSENVISTAFNCQHEHPSQRWVKLTCERAQKLALNEAL